MCLGFRNRNGLEALVCARDVRARPSPPSPAACQLLPPLLEKRMFALLKGRSHQ